MGNRIYYIIEDIDVPLRDIFLDLSGYVAYDDLYEPMAILDVRGTEAIYKVTDAFTTDNNKLVSSTTIEKVS